ncbi:heat-inducible transcriptional repressor HrcA [Ruminococcaceae bacterium OttesenSCG-928-N02]|nr:heat-inducible transcriptional repressor HrcA [Ruminococcaceae bacterium OttesenSCG-928-N02]
MNNMDDRKRKVLSTIVHIYAEDGEPVGSNLLSQNLEFVVSTATLRNEMAALTKLGYLLQPHTSAGRIPSLQGYRYYIENLLQEVALPGQVRRAADETLAALSYDKERLVQNSAAALSEMAGLPALAMTPYHADNSIAHFEVIQAGRYTAAVLGVSAGGEVSTRVATTRVPLKGAHLAELQNALNTHLAFVQGHSLTRETMQTLLRAAGPKVETMLELVNAAVQLITGLQRPAVYVQGRERLLDFPELDSSLRGVIALFGDNPCLQELLTIDGEKVKFIWGDEMASYYLPELCIVCAPYGAGGGAKGTLALAGPARMQYTQVVPLLQYFAQALGRMMLMTDKEE